MHVGGGAEGCQVGEVSHEVLQSPANKSKFIFSMQEFHLQTISLTLFSFWNVVILQNTSRGSYIKKKNIKKKQYCDAIYVFASQLRMQKQKKKKTPFQRNSIPLHTTRVQELALNVTCNVEGEAAG